MEKSQRIHCSLGPEFVIRIAGLPLSSLHRLRFSSTLEALSAVFRLEHWLREQAEVLSEKLYTAIGGLAGPEYRHARYRLMALRRAVFQVKLPKSQDVSDETLSVLSAELAAELREWHQKIQELHAALLSVEETVFAAELREKSSELWQLARSEVLLQGLLLASNDLYMDVQRWQAEHAAPPAQFERRLAFGIMNYLSRIAAKTSPYSTFTSFAHGCWRRQGDGDALTYERAGLKRRMSVVEANNLIMRQITRDLAERAEIRPHLMLSVNPTLLEIGESYHFLVSLREEGEAIVRLARTPTLQEIIRLVRTLSPVSYGSIVHLLMDFDRQGREEAIVRFLDQLIEKGLLLLDFAVSEQSLDYLGQIVETLRPIAQGETKAITAQLSALHTDLGRFARAEQATLRCEIMGHIKRELESAYTRLQPGDRPGYRLPPKNLIYENTLVPDLRFSCNEERWQEVIADLSALHRLLGLCDPSLPGQIALTKFFVERFGCDARVGLLPFYEYFCKESKEAQPLQPGQSISAATVLQLFKEPFQVAKSGLEELAQFAELRRQVEQLWLSQSLNEDRVLRLTREQLAPLLADFPAVVQTPRSMAYYCQVLWRGDAPALVLNAVQSGFGRSLGRLHYIEKQAALSDAPRSKGIPCGPSQPLPVSVQGVFGANINLRVDAMPYEIVYPGVVGGRPPEEQIPFSDLWIIYDPATNRLQLLSERLRRALLPVHMGIMADYWLPPMYRFLIWAFSEGLTDPTWSWQLFDVADPGLTQEVTFSPRTGLGNIFLTRAHWLIPPAHMPVREKEDSPFDYFLKVQRWREKYHLPAECFIRATAFDPQKIVSGEVTTAELYAVGKKRKPVYIDLRNYFSLLLLERIASESALGFVMEEALPGSDDLVLTDGQHSYVSEYIFELHKEEG